MGVTKLLPIFSAKDLDLLGTHQTKTTSLRFESAEGTFLCASTIFVCPAFGKGEAASKDEAYCKVEYCSSFGAVAPLIQWR
jgi:hypothetical protein